MLGGSLKIGLLSQEVETLLRNSMAAGDQFVVGDAPGADSNFQRILKEADSADVEVFFSGSEPRFNLGGWPVVHVDSGLRGKGHAMHGAKDRQMVETSGRGLFAWDGTSAGTITNVLDFVGQSKPFLLVVQETAGVFIIDALPALQSRFPSIVLEAENRLAAAHRRMAKRIRENAKGSNPTLF